MKLARTLRLDDSDKRVFEIAAEPDEWAISGAFEFSNWTEDMLGGKARQTFANGWLGLESFGRATFVAVAEIAPHEYEALVDTLAHHFIAHYDAPDLAAAQPVARDELDYMRDLCEEHDPNSLLVVERELVAAGVSERFRSIRPQEASLDLVAMHGSLDED